MSSTASATSGTAAPRAHPPKPAGHRGIHRVRASGRTRAGPSSGRQSTSSGTPAAAYRVALTERSKSTDESDTSMSRRRSGRYGRTLGLVDCFGARFSRFVRRGREAAYATEATRCRCRCSWRPAVRAGPVRLAALEWLCELDGVEAARRRARSDHDAAVKNWQPRPQPPPS
jgi:hypothetical protein